MDPDLVVPDPEKSLYDGAIEPWASSTSTYYLQTLDSIAKRFRKSLRTPWEELPEKMRELILYGSGEEPVELSYDDGLRRTAPTGRSRACCRTCSGAGARPTPPGSRRSSASISAPRRARPAAAIG